MSKKVDSMVKLSKTSKMPCPSWSLPAVSTCPGARGKGGKLVPVCQGCYATTGFYNMPTVKEPREYNRKDWQRREWVHEMTLEVSKNKYFRWFDSGDVYCVGLAHKIYLVMQATSDTQHWLPTRSHKIPKIKAWLIKMRRLPNVSVRYSSDNIDSYERKLHGSVVVTPEGVDKYTNRIQKETKVVLPTMLYRYAHLKVPKDLFLCQAYTRKGKCGDCRACWDKRIKTIAYPTHGAKMDKVIQTINNN